MAESLETLEVVAEQLYRGSPEDFVTRRTEQVKIARAAKDRELATAIGQLRRPTRSAWLVDLLAEGATEQLEELFEIGTALMQAQQQRDGAELRELSTRRRSVVDALVRSSVELAATQGYDAPESARQEVAQTLQAALADSATADAVRRGVLAEVVAYGGFGFGPLESALPAAHPASSSASTAHGKHKELREREAEQKAQVQAELAAAEQELAQAEQRSSDATAEADRLAEEVERLGAELKTAEQSSRQADRDARAARKEAERQRSVVESLRDRST